MSATNLESVVKTLDVIPNLNRGGCGISALAIYRWCKENGVEVSDRPFVVLCEDEWELEHNNIACQEGDVDEIWIPHVVIEVDGILWDSTGNEHQHSEYSLLSYSYRQDYQLSEEELLGIINTDAWNSTFNRNKFTDVIATELDIDLSDVELF